MNANNLESRLEHYFDRLWPIPRSLAGPGFRESLQILGELVPFEWLYFPTGTQVFDWTIPPEWTVREAFIQGPDGIKRADFATNNLHLVGYSAPFRGRISLEQLKPHLHTIPELPKAIPYLTSYYNKIWGFCLSQEELDNLPKGDYEVVVDTSFEAGSLVVAEAVLPGDTEREILITSYLCHPSMANNELSGPLVLAFLYEQISKMPHRRYTFRFVIGPETIGTIAYLHKRSEHLLNTLDAGYVLTCIGDIGPFTYKKSRNGNSLADKSAEEVLSRKENSKVINFFPNGSDERQYNSPGLNLPVGSMMRSSYNCYPQYHTSLDNKDVISFKKLAEAVNVCTEIVSALDYNITWVSNNQTCEPFLSKYGIYPTTHSVRSIDEWKMAILWIMNLADGEHDLLEIARKSRIAPKLLHETALKLEQVGLLRRANQQGD